MAAHPDDLDRALDRVAEHLSPRLARALAWIRAPGRWWLRVPAGILFVIGGLLWFLPVLGLYMLPLGLALLAIDTPFLRRPVGRMILWLDKQWRALRQRLTDAG